MNTKPTIKNFLIVIFPAIFIVLIIFFLIMPQVRQSREDNNQINVTNFEECVMAGNPVMESYPRQCQHNGQIFTENIDQVVGGDKDEYGCIGSAGYSWCEPKNKCLRIWEEECYDSDQQEIQYLFAEKYNKDISEINIVIKQEVEDYIEGNVSFLPGESENSGIFLATKIDNKWNIIHDGQGAYACLLVDSYNFPPEMVSDCFSQDTDYLDVTSETAKMLIDTKPELIVIDVSPHYDEGHLPGAVSYYLGDGSLDEAIPSLDKNKEYLVYCHVDSVAIAGAQKLVDAGFNIVYRLEGNYSAWVAAGYPIEK